MRKATHIIGVGLALLACLIVVLLAWRLQPGEKRLLARARPITNLQTATPNGFLTGVTPPLSFTTIPCFWLSDRKAILFQPASKGGYLEAWQLDAATGAKRLLQTRNSGMSESIRTFGSSWLYLTPPRPSRASVTQLLVDCVVSPDSKWVLLGQIIRNPGYSIAACAMDGPRNIHFAHSIEPMWLPWPVKAWMPDSRHWVQMHPPQQRKGLLRVFSLDTPDQAQDFHLSSPAALAFSWLQVLGVTQHGDVLILPAQLPTTVNKLDVEEYSLPTDLKGNHTLTPTLRHISAPSDSQILTASMAFSPQGNRLAFLTYTSAGQPHPSFLRRLWQMLGQRARPQTALWTCRLDGSEMQEVGHLSGKADDTQLFDLRWLPSGKRLSFVYKGTLYTVPAD